MSPSSPLLSLCSPFRRLLAVCLAFIQFLHLLHTNTVDVYCWCPTVWWPRESSECSPVQGSKLSTSKLASFCQEMHLAVQAMLPPWLQRRDPGVGLCCDKALLLDLVAVLHLFVLELGLQCGRTGCQWCQQRRPELWTVGRLFFYFGAACVHLLVSIAVSSNAQRLVAAVWMVLRQCHCL